MKKKRRGNLLQRGMAVLLSAVLVIGMVSGAVPEEAYAKTTREAQSIDEGNEVRYSTDNGSTWKESSLLDALWDSNVVNGDNVQIELLRDITLIGSSGGNWASYQQMIGTKDGSTWTINGKGHKITRGEGCKALFVTMGSSTVTMKNITIDGGAVWSSDDPATRTNSGISLRANAHLLYVYNGATMILESGVTLQNSDLDNSNDGAAVMVGSAGNTGKGTLIIKDGVEIKGNKANNGGAIYVYDSKSKLTIEGGRIHGNQAMNYGGAVCSLGTVEMKGGKIDNNQTAAGAGGGIIVYAGLMTLSGSPVIEGNISKSGADNNVYLNKKTISISNPLTEGAKVGVTTNEKPVADAPVAVTEANAADYSDYFFSDVEKYRVENTANDNIIQLVLKKKIAPTLSLPETVTIHTDSATESSAVILDEVKEKLEISGVDGLSQDEDYVMVENYDADTNKATLEFKLTDNGKEKYYIDTDSTTKAECTIIIHNWNTEWSKNETSHWYSCPSCDLKKDESLHTYETKWKKDETNHWHKCVCGGKTDLAAHNEDDGTVTKEPTETENGIRTYKCCDCGYVMRTETIDKTGGTQTPDTGKITIDKEQGTNTPNTDFGTSQEDLIGAVLTPEEQDNVADGTDIKIVLDIENIDDSVSEADKQLIKNKIGNDTVGQYLDINLFKIIGNSKTAVSHTNRKIKIVITIPAGLKNADTGKVRTYSIVRVHDGVAEILADLDHADDTITIETDKFSTYALVYHDTDKNAGDNINTGNPDNNTNNNSSSGIDSSRNDDDSSADKSNDKKDNDSGKKSSAKSSANTAEDNEPETGDTTPIEIYATLSMVAGFSWLLLYFGDRRRGMTEQKKKEITASIIAWAKKGKRLRKMVALALIFVILVYYHSIGKRTNVDWKEAYEK